MTPLQIRANAVLGAFHQRGISMSDYRDRADMQAKRDACLLEWSALEALLSFLLTWGEAVRERLNAGYVVVDSKAPRNARLEIV